MFSVTVFDEPPAPSESEPGDAVIEKSGLWITVATVWVEEEPGFCAARATAAARPARSAPVSSRARRIHRHPHGPAVFRPPVTSGILPAESPPSHQEHHL